MEPEERRKVSLMQALSTIRNEKIAIRKDAAQRRKQVKKRSPRILPPCSSLLARRGSRAFAFEPLCIDVHADPSLHIA